MRNLALSLTLPIVLGQQTTPAPPPPAISLECQEAPSPIGALRLTIRNEGVAPVGILLGRSLGNGEWYELRDLTLLVKRPGQDVEEFEYRSRGFPTGVAGRMDHWILTLPSESSYSMTLSPRDFFSPRTSLSPTRLPSPAELSLRLLGRPVTYDLNPDMAGLRTMRLWTGTTTSNTVPVPTACRD